MAERILKHKISHWALRLLVLLTVISAVLDIYYSSSYYAWFQRHGLAGALNTWNLSSGLVFPLLVGLEWFWLRRSETEISALAIDTLLVIGYLSCWVVLAFPFLLLD